MTAFTDKQQTPEQNNTHTMKDDFEPVELQTRLPDESELTIEPLEHRHDDEYAIDDLPVNEHLSGSEIWQINNDTNSTNKQTIKHTDDLADVNFAKIEQAQQIQAAKTLNTHFNIAYTDYRSSSKQADNSSQKSAAQENAIPADTTVMGNKSEHNPDRNNPIIDGFGRTVAVLSQFKSKQENFNKQQDKLIQACADNVKKTTAVTYVALFFGAIALVGAGAMGIMLFKAREDVATLIDSVGTLKEDMKNISSKLSAVSTNNNSHIEPIDNIPAPPKAISSQNQQPSSLGENEETEEDLDKPVNTRESPASASDLSPSFINKVETVDTAPLANIDPVPSKKTVPKKSTALSFTTPEQSETTIKEDVLVENKSGKTWSVKINESFKHEQQAKSKAASMEKKGIPVKVVMRKLDNKTWYQLQVTGFKSKKAASLYANELSKKKMK